MFEQICYNRFFEFEVAKAIEEKRIQIPVYLSAGQESIPVGVHSVYPDAAIFAQHRCHSWYLTYGGSPEKLRDELLGLETGCAKGMGGSASIHDPDIPMFGHSGLMGDQVPIAVGYALESQKTTIAVIGDGAVEEDYVLASLGFAATKNCPILFVVEDNNLAILTEKKVRRSWSIVDVAKGFGLNSAHCSDDPTEIKHTLEILKLPALINVHTHRHLWHAGSGNDGPPEFNRYEDIKSRYRLGFLGDEMERNVINEVRELWQKQ